MSVWIGKDNNISAVHAVNLGKQCMMSVRSGAKAHPSKLRGVYANQALLDVDINRFKRISVDPVIFGQEHRKGFVTCVSSCFGLVNLIDEGQFVSRRAAVEIQDLVPLFIRILAGNQTGSGNGYCVHIGVAGVCRHVHNRHWSVKGAPRWLGADFFEDLVRPSASIARASV